MHNPQQKEHRKCYTIPKRSPHRGKRRQRSSIHGETQFKVCFELDVAGVEDTLVIVETVEIAGAIGVGPGRVER